MALDLIQPEIPSAQSNRAPDLFLQSLGTGLQAFARFADIKRQSEMDVLKLAEHERVSQEEHEIQREKMASDADYRAKALEVTRDLNDAHINYFNAQADFYKNTKKQGLLDAVEFNKQTEALLGDVNKSANELRLNDPKFATDEPVQYAANVMKFRDMFQLSPLPQVKNAVTQFQRTADQMKIPLKMGATFDEEKGIWVGGSEKMVPVWQIVRNLNDPLQQEQTTNALEASGHLRVINDFETINGVKVPRKSSQLDPALKATIDKGKDVKFEHSNSRVPAAMMRRGDSRGGGTSGPTPFPDPDLPPIQEPAPEYEPTSSNGRRSASPQFSETDTDKTIAQAKAAVKAGANAEAVAARLREMGISPDELMG